MLNRRVLKIFMNDLLTAYSELILHALSYMDAVTMVWVVFEETKAYISKNCFVAKCSELFEDDFKTNISVIVEIFQYLKEIKKKM